MMCMHSLLSNVLYNLEQRGGAVVATGIGRGTRRATVGTARAGKNNSTSSGYAGFNGGR